MNLNSKAGTESPAVPLRVRGTMLFGFGVIALVLGGFGIWASVAELASAVVAGGTVTLDSNRKKVQPLQGGLVKEILVRDGDRVAANDVIIRLDETRARAGLGIVQGALFSALGVRARLTAEQVTRNEIIFPAELLASKDGKDVAEIIAGQKTLFETRRESLKGQVAIFNQKIRQIDLETEGLVAEKQAKIRQISFIREELSGLKILFERGHANRVRILALEREKARLEGELGAIVATIARSRTTQGATRLQIIQLGQTFRESVVKELRDTQAKILDLRERIFAARYTLKHIDIRAPVSGTVVGLAVHTIGAVVNTGETLMEIVPKGDKLLVEVRINPLDIDNVAVGQSAVTEFTAFKQRSAPSLNGVVSYVSADSLTDQRTGQAYFTARVTIPDNEVKRLGDHRLVPGMPAQIMIQTGERTAIRYLVQPILDSMNRAWRED